MSTRTTILMAILTALCCRSAMAAELKSDHSALAKFMLESLPAKSGLCVHLGVEDGDLDVALSDGGRFLVHGLGTEQDGIERARKRIAAARLEGAVSVELGSFNPLPYADNIVSLLVVDDLPSLLKKGLKLEEVTRVLSPHGTAWLGRSSGGGGGSLTGMTLKTMLINAGLKEFEIIEKNGIWAKYIKPRPAGMDVWTHQAYDASGNPASTDQMGMPNGVRWIAGPNWPRGYRKSGTRARVVSEKHLAYIFRDRVLPGVPEEWTLYVRDAYNGLLLWKKALNTQSPTLVSAGDRFIISVDQDYWGKGGGIIAVDADTGRLVHTYENAKGCRSVFHIDGKLIVRVPEGLRCLDLVSGKVVWSIPNNPGSEIRGFKAANGKIFLHFRSRGPDGKEATLFKCLDLKTGKELWKNNTASWHKGGIDFLFNQYDVLVARTGTTLHGISAINGSHLWSRPVQGKYNTVRTLAAAGLIWAQNDMTVGGPGWEGWDPQTGKIVKRVAKWTERVPYHWGRCCGNYATPNFIICGGFDFADFKTGEIKLFNAAKNGCTSGRCSACQRHGVYVSPTPVGAVIGCAVFSLMQQPKCLTSPRPTKPIGCRRDRRMAPRRRHRRNRLKSGRPTGTTPAAVPPPPLRALNGSICYGRDK